MKKASEVFKTIRFAKLDPTHDKGPKGSTDDEEHGVVSSQEFQQQVDHVKKRAMQEDLRKWFDKDHPEGGWKRINSKGEAIGPCAREPGEPKPKCMSNEKRAKLSKTERASAVAAKRKHDPNPERKGEPINVSNFGKGKISEDMENLEEKNVPTSPEKWAQAKAQAKAKFDVYPSAYANGWASKKYKEMGGGWKSVSEAVKDKFDIGEYDQEGDMAKSDLRSIMANAKKMHDMIEDSDNLPEWVQSKITKAEDYISTVTNYMTSEMNEQHADKGKFQPVKPKMVQNTPNVSPRPTNDSANVKLKEDKMELEEEIAGWIAHYNGQKHEIKKHEAKDLYDAKQKAIAHFKAPKSKHGLIAVKPAYNEAVVVKTNKEIGSRVSDIGPGGKEHNVKTDSAYAKYRKMGSSSANARARAAGEKNAHMFEDEQMDEGYYKDIDTNRKEDERLGSWKKETPWKKISGSGTVTDKSGAKHTPMSRARDLARAAMKKNIKEFVVNESRLADIVREAQESAKKKKKEAKEKDKDVSDDKFQKDPELSTQIIRND